MVNFIFVLSVLVVFHELGHYLAARYFGVRVESFSIGLGPRLLGIQKNGTDFKVCALPFGGYVKMAGSSVIGPATSDPDELTSKPRWQRLIIASMGPIFNFLLAIGLLAGLYMHTFERPVYLGEEARIAHVRADSDAARAGLREGDIVRSLDGVPIATWQDLVFNEMIVVQREVPIAFERQGTLFRSAISIAGDSELRQPPNPGWSPEIEVWLGTIARGGAADEAGLRAGDRLVSIAGQAVATIEQTVALIDGSEGRLLPVVVERAGERAAVDVRARLDEASGHWRIGVALRPLYEATNMPLPFWEALDRSLTDNIGFAGMILRTLKGLVMGHFSVKTLEGPVGIYEHTQTAASYGFDSLILLMALISVNLAIVNLLPIPVLDGGHIVLLGVESLLRRDVSEAMRNRIMQLGILFILILFGLVMYNDVMRQFFGS